MKYILPREGVLANMAIHMQQSQSQSQIYVPFVYPRHAIRNSYWDPRSQDIYGPMRRNQSFPAEHPEKIQATSFPDSTRDAQLKEKPYIYEGRINRNQTSPTEHSGRYNDTTYANGNMNGEFAETSYISDGRNNANQALPIGHIEKFQDTSLTNGKGDAIFEEISHISDGRRSKNKFLLQERQRKLYDTLFDSDKGDRRFEGISHISDGRISRSQDVPIENQEKLPDTFFANCDRDGIFEEMSYISDGSQNRNQFLPIEHQERLHDPSFANAYRGARFEEMCDISDRRRNKNPFLPVRHPEINEEPPSQTMRRDAREDVPKKKRQMIWIVITRIASAILIILDCISDWLQYYDMHTENAEHDTKGIFKQECQKAEDIVKKYMYFTIAGTVLAVIQLANIIFQIYCEIRFHRNITDKDENKMKYPLKLLDGRTETFYSLLFIEIPQALLVAGHQNVCFPTCNYSSKNHLEKKIKNIFNGGAALLNNAWRYVTSEDFYEESTEEKDGKCCKGEWCCGSFARTVFKCCCPCCCCFHRYECTTPFCICGKTLVCDACKCTANPWFCEIPFGCCTLFYCPLNDKENPKSGQRLFKVESECCKSLDNSYEPFIFHTFLAKIVSILYLLVYVVNLHKLFCEENFIIDNLAKIPNWLLSLL